MKSNFGLPPKIELTEVKNYIKILRPWCQRETSGIQWRTLIFLQEFLKCRIKTCLEGSEWYNHDWLLIGGGEANLLIATNIQLTERETERGGEGERDERNCENKQSCEHTVYYEKPSSVRQCTTLSLLCFPLSSKPCWGTGSHVQDLPKVTLMGQLDGKDSLATTLTCNDHQFLTTEDRTGTCIKKTK